MHDMHAALDFPCDYVNFRFVEIFPELLGSTIKIGIFIF